MGKTPACLPWALINSFHNALGSAWDKKKQIWISNFIPSSILSEKDVHGICSLCRRERRNGRKATISAHQESLNLS